MLRLHQRVLAGMIGIVVLGTYSVHPVAAAVNVSGRVVNQADGSGVPLVQICLDAFIADTTCEATTTTDSSGAYTFTAVPDGIYDVIPSPGDFAPTRRIIVVGINANPVTADFNIPVPHVWSKTETSAHRGDVTTSPENTYAAFARAINKRAAYVELDVLLSDEGKLVVAHGSLYKETTGTDVVTQIYGPTAPCFNNSVETAPWSLMSTCDVGTRGVGDHKTDYPRFADERLPLLDQVLARYASHTSWMIELKATAIQGSDAQKAERNTQLGQAVNNLLADKGNIWVTSFNVDALRGVTSPSIKKMHQVLINPVNDGAVREVDQAIIEGYDALNLELSMLDDPIFPYPSPTWGAYIHSKGLLVSAYKILGGRHKPEDNQAAVTGKADFFMTDIIDDLQARNGDRDPAVRVPQTVDLLAGTSKITVRNNEIFSITATGALYDKTGLPVANPTAKDRLTLPPLSWITAEYRNNALNATITVPIYGSAGTITYQTRPLPNIPIDSQLVQALKNGGKIAVTASGTSIDGYSNVEPYFSFSKDDITVKANEVSFPSPDGRNRAIVGTNCVGPNDPQIAKNIDVSMKLTLAPDVEDDPFQYPLESKPVWTLSNVRFYVDNEEISTSPGGGTQVVLPSSGPILRDLSPGEHTFKVTYTARSGDLSRDEVWTEPFTVKLREPDPVTGLCLGTGDIQVTLTWGSYTDLDLHVTDPSGVEIYYNRRTSPSGGALDVDANAGCSSNQTNTPVENIYWPYGKAPTGTYNVRVVVYATCSQPYEPFSLRIRIGDQVQTLNTTYSTSFTYPLAEAGAGSGNR